MADQDEKQRAGALKRAKWAHDKWTRAQEKAEGLRALRNVTILDAIDAGLTQREIAAELGISQPAINSIIKRTDRIAKHNASN